MIYRGETPISGRYRGNRVITTVYRGSRLIWEAVKSCFGKGYWVNEPQYSNSEAWKNE